MFANLTSEFDKAPIAPEISIRFGAAGNTAARNET